MKRYWQGQHLVILPTLLSELRGSVIPPRWIVRSVFNDKSHFMAINLTVVSGVREFQKYFFSDGEVLRLLSRKVFFDEPAVGTSKVVEGVGEVLAYVNFTVRIGDLVNNLHYRLLTPKITFPRLACSSHVSRQSCHAHHLLKLYRLPHSYHFIIACRSNTRPIRRPCNGFYGSSMTSIREGACPAYNIPNL